MAKASTASLLDRVNAEIELRRRLSFSSWLPIATPAYTWTWSHLVYLQSHLQMIANNEINRLMVFMPPRHGKSEMATIRYPVWRLRRDPSTRVIIGAYNQTLASKFSRRARKIAESFIQLSAERSAAEDWETQQGGGVRAVGVGGGITGQGGNLIIIDDPVKSREEANSRAYRDRVWDWYTNDLYSRLEPGAAMIINMTRWHEDDLAGRILASNDASNWTVITFPAIAEENDILGRSIGDALCPDRFDVDDLARIANVQGSWTFSALYQQRPLPAAGGIFQRHWFGIVQAIPADVTNWVRWWDKAATAGGGNYSSGVLMGTARNGTYYIANVTRGQWSSGERDKIMLQTAALDAQLPGSVEIWTEQEGGSGGKESAEATIRLLAGYAVHAQTSTGSKEVRAQPFAAQAEAGNIKLLAGDWNETYIDELSSFPYGKNDDQVDGSSGAFNKLALGARDYGIPKSGQPRFATTRPAPTGMSQRPVLPGFDRPR